MRTFSLISLYLIGLLILAPIGVYGLTAEEITSTHARLRLRSTFTWPGKADEVLLREVVVTASKPSAQ